MLGPEEASSLVIFSWWGCQHCRDTWEKYGPALLEKAQVGELRLVYRPIAQNKTESLLSGALYCLPRGEALFWIKDLFEIANLSELALRKHPNIRPYLNCLDAPETRLALQEDIRAVSRWRITYTPTIFWQGRRLYPEEAVLTLQSLGR